MILQRIIISLIFLSFNSIIYGQLLFPEKIGWGKEQNLMLPEDFNLTYEVKTDSLVKGDTVNIKFYYPNKQLAIEGQCLIKGSNLSFSKMNSWNYYYENGKLWSARTYTNKSGKLKSVEKLLDPDGNDLSQGYGRYKGRYRLYAGYGFIYNNKGKAEKIAHYKGGLISETFSPEKYSKEQLQRLIIREFTTSDDIKFEELSIEEAVELQKTVKKPILLNASTSWNGWTKRGYKEMFEQPHIAKLIHDNFILAYIDCEDSRDISITVNGTVQEFKGSNGRGNHAIIPAINGKRITSTPTFLFINTAFELEHRHSGIELKEDEFLKFLEFYLSKEYQIKTWEEYIE
jgi:Highly conserved protein containing a thioredoxin domain